MEDTARLRRGLDWSAGAIVFGHGDEAIGAEMPFYVRIDQAHIVMLVEQGILSQATGRALLTAIGELAAQRYAPLRGRHAPRGLYLLYERHLIERLGEEVGGAAHIGRSRNDINATMVRLRLRDRHHDLLREALRLLAVLVRRARSRAHLTMPLYMHHQAALPGTYGHYLAGVALALVRDLRDVAAVGDDVDRCPLGAGAVGGTTVPIDSERTARLLGFRHGVLHSIDAVASRDFVLRLLGAATTLGVTLSRIAADLQLWSTAEFGLVHFPDSLVGSSSMMPQKRNAFLLEHIKGRSGAPLGALTASVLAMHATPFSNSVAVGTEGVRPLWQALDDVTEATVLTRLVVAGAEPQHDTMRRRAAERLTVATELANGLVLSTGMAFRRAHHLVGELVTEVAEQRTSLAMAAEALFREHGATLDPALLDPALVAGNAAFGGGPAQPSQSRIVAELIAQWTAAARDLRGRVTQWGEGERALHDAVADLLQQPRLRAADPARD